MWHEPPSLPVAGPVLAVCGWSGAGKTTLLEEAVPELVARGLAVAAVKHDTHGIDVDRPGKDSDRLFRAGADVVLRGPGQALLRSHVRPAGTAADGGCAPLLSLDVAREDSRRLRALLVRLLARYDVVLVEGHKTTPLPKVWLASEGEDRAPDGVDDVRAVLPRGASRLPRFREFLGGWLSAAWREPPVFGGVLVGGRATRMGGPKQLLVHEGRTFLERVVDAVGSRVNRVVLLGEGRVPESCVHLPRLPDPPGLAGPLAGILSAMRWGPGASWIVAACDQPRIRPEALDWLLRQAAPGVWAVLPQGASGRPEPLLALYDARARAVLESLAAAGRRAPRLLTDHPRCVVPRPPPGIRDCWDGVNLPAEYEALRRADSGRRAPPRAAT